MNRIKIRNAREQDVPAVLGFIKELAEYEGALEQVIATEENLRSTLFKEDATAYALIALCDEKPVGFAVYFFSYSTWLGNHSLFLEDLYVSPKYRCCGIGRQLLGYLARTAVSHRCNRLEWNVLKWNLAAIKFYQSLGAAPQSEWVGYRLEKKKLEGLARRSLDQ